jgi:hypothetical protein
LDFLFHFSGKSNDPLSVDYLPSIFEFVPSPKKRKLKADAERYEQRQSLKKQRQNNVRVKEAAKALLMIAEPPEEPHSSSSYSQPPDQDATSTSSSSSNNEINIFIGPPSPTSNDLADPGDAPINSQTPDLHMEIAALRRENLALKQELLKVTITMESLKQNPAKLKFFTGLSHITILETVIDFLEPLLPDPGKLSKFQQIIVTLIKLRLNVGHQLIAYQFGVHASTISKHLHNVVSLMYTVLVPEVIRWPEREQLRKTLPMCFRATFPKCAVIIDCFEVQVEKASDQTANAQTYSQYKSRNTLKYLIGISPLGAVIFISKGRTSDKYITENSGFLRHLVPGDVVMADRGFLIEESVAMQGAKLEIPAFTRGKSQLDKREVESTRKLASVRIHVERVIGTIRQKYQVLQGPVELTFTVPDVEENVMLYDKMVHVACALTNLSKPIVPSD